MPDGTVKKVVVGVRQPDGSIKLPDGRIKLPNGKVIMPGETTVSKPVSQGNSSQEVKPIPQPAKQKARNFIAEDDDMEFGFLNIESELDDE